MAFAAMWAAEMEDVRWQWLEKRTLERMKISGGGECQPWRGCTVVVPLWLWREFSSCALAVCYHHFPCASTAWWHACLRSLNQGVINAATKLCAIFSRDFSLPTLQCSGKLCAGARNWTKVCHRWLLLKKVRMSPISAEKVLGNFTLDRLSQPHCKAGCEMTGQSSAKSVGKERLLPMFARSLAAGCFCPSVSYFTSFGLMHLFLVFCYLSLNMMVTDFKNSISHGAWLTKGIIVSNSLMLVIHIISRLVSRISIFGSLFCFCSGMHC